MNYIIIMPAFNEGKRIGNALASLERQTLLPKRLIVVDDGSTDDTAAIVEAFAARNSWVRLVRKGGRAQHSPGAKIVQAFYTGFHTIDEDYDFVVKMDADLELPANYFERMARIFEENPKVGIAGGIYLIERNGEWTYESYADMDHVKGPCKSYRKACFEDIGGLRESVGWDSVDEMLALYHGWQVKADPELHVKHTRHRGAETGFVKVMIKVGYAMYRMRYGFFIALTSAAKAGLVNRPYILTGLATMAGFMIAWLRRDDFIVNEGEGKFIRRFRWRRMLGKFRSLEV